MLSARIRATSSTIATLLRHSFWIGSDRVPSAGKRIVAILLLLFAASLVAWGWAMASLGSAPTLLGAALLAWGFGLLHAVDADHIAAIDNVTRRLMQDGQRPVAVGLFFSLGHSTVVVLASLLIVLALGWFR